MCQLCLPEGMMQKRSNATPTRSCSTRWRSFCAVGSPVSSFRSWKRWTLHPRSVDMSFERESPLTPAGGSGWMDGCICCLQCPVTSIVAHRSRGTYRWKRFLTWINLLCPVKVCWNRLPKYQCWFSVISLWQSQAPKQMSWWQLES